MMVSIKGYPRAKEAPAINTPSPRAQMDMKRIKRFSSRASGEGAGVSRAARPATRPNAVRSPQHNTTPVTS